MNKVFASNNSIPLTSYINFSPKNWQTVAIVVRITGMVLAFIIQVI